MKNFLNFKKVRIVSHKYSPKKFHNQIRYSATSLLDGFNKRIDFNSERETGLFDIKELKSPNDYEKFAKEAIEFCNSKIEQLSELEHGSREIIK